MIQLTEKQLAALSLLLGKLREKTSVLGYLVAALGFFGVNDPGLAEQIAGGVALGASLVLVLFNDATVRSWIVRAAPIPAEAMEPEPVTIPHEADPPAILQELPMSFLDKLSIFNKLTPIVTAAVQVVETVAPNSPGVVKFEKAKASVAAAIDIKESASDLWDVIEPLIEMVVAALKPAPTPVVTPPPADQVSGTTLVQ